MSAATDKVEPTDTAVEEINAPVPADLKAEVAGTFLRFRYEDAFANNSCRSRRRSKSTRFLRVWLLLSSVQDSEGEEEEEGPGLAALVGDVRTTLFASASEADG